MKIDNFIDRIQNLGINDFIGVPDSTLKPFCDYLYTNISSDYHHVTVNEGSAIALATGIYLGTQKISCVYMQNSGMGNALNPIVSLINKEVYDIPSLMVIGYRGEPNTKDEPQHKFQGKITLPLLEVLNIKYKVIDNNTSTEELDSLFKDVKQTLISNEQFAIVVKKGTFESDSSFMFNNHYTLNREAAIQIILKQINKDDCIVSTTGKISREVYEQLDELYGDHSQAFLTVGGMGHSAMIAYGIAKKRKDKHIYCLDGDGAVLMHMGSLAFIGSNPCSNYTHITLNNCAHESVGGMPTNCQNIPLHEIAKNCHYKNVFYVTTSHELIDILKKVKTLKGPTYIEIMVSLGARSDLGRPKESAVENKENFIKKINEEKL